MQSLMTLTLAMKNYLQLFQIEPTGKIFFVNSHLAEAKGNFKKKFLLAFNFHNNNGVNCLV